MPKANRAIVFVPLVSIAYIAVSVYFYGKGITELFIALWLPLVAFNTWAIASALSQNARRGINWIIGFLTAVVIGAIGAMVFMCIAFNAYGT